MRLALALLLALALHAEAETCRVKEDTLVFAPGKYEDFVQLMDSGRADQAGECCLRCTIDAGTTVEIQKKNDLLHIIRVQSGPSLGCVGEMTGDLLTCE